MAYRPVHVDVLSRHSQLMTIVNRIRSSADPSSGRDIGYLFMHLSQQNSDIAHACDDLARELQQRQRP